ncbi:GNAT family N-acetyltransferase [Rhodobium gokarnense]|uniref:Ribosomal protein S18 acetylase RimI-like enzyme n=1 Tax=Rhodobium gokarnense TaxID=364296 RepID=A0ABT3H8S8_9HYPH|nr:GNAT family N-acetyltransferase [Rhodobium gokarnense]MCW2306800.1 ribosomal protein S18 acetylase RimI-like enzyme [Rhodobium gokarnense]
MADPALVRRIEDAQLSVWPGVRTAIDGSWIVRISGGHTNRANSLNILDPHDGDGTDERLDWVFRLYRRAGLDPVVRVTPLTPAPVLARTDALGFARFGETLMLVRDAPAVPVTEAATPAQAVEVLETATDEFLGAVARFSNQSDRERAGFWAILSAMADETVFVLARDREGMPASCLIAALHRDIATVFAVATDPAARRRGHARACLGAAFAWAAGAGATLFWIGVEVDNAPARALYEGCGFAEAYRYHYRRAPRPAEEGTG